MPPPETRGSGSSVATTTRVIPAARMRSVHGPVRPTWQHGSSVTYIVAPRLRGPAAASATDLGMGLAGPLVEALPHDHAVDIDHDRAHERVRRGGALRARGVEERAPHHAQVVYHDGRNSAST